MNNTIDPIRGMIYTNDVQLSEQNFQLRQEIQNLQEALYQAERYKKAIDFIQEMVNKHYAGVSFDGFTGGNYSSYRMMFRNNQYYECFVANDIVGVIEVAMRYEKKLVQT